MDAIKDFTFDSWVCPPLPSPSIALIPHPTAGLKLVAKVGLKASRTGSKAGSFGVQPEQVGILLSGLSPPIIITPSSSNVVTTTFARLNTRYPIFGI